MEYKVYVDGIEYDKSKIVSANIKRPLFDQLSIGNACEAEISVQFYPTQAIPRMATVVPYVKIDADAAWEKLGTFYTDERSSASGLLMLRAYDSMLKADRIWVPDQILSFPMTMPTAVNVIAALMGITVDARTVLNSSYTIDYPANDYTLRNVLCYIAAAHGGNWIITRGDELLLVPLKGSYPAETYYLITEFGGAITFGGTRILV